VLWVTSPRDGAPSSPSAPSPAPADARRWWLDPSGRVDRFERETAATFFGGEAHARFDPQLGPGNLAAFLGSEPHYTPDTVWFDPCIDDPDRHPALAFDPRNPHFRAQMAIADAGLAAGRAPTPT
jgi:hypothetical protein